MTLCQPTIPKELFRLILSNIDDRGTLCSLCLSCSDLLLEAQRILYRTFTWAPTNRRHLQFLVTIRENQRLAAFVRCYHFGAYTLDILRDVAPALQNMINLKELSIAIHTRDIDTFPWNECTFQLRRLRWVEQDDDPYHIVRSAFTQWLTMQKALRHLDWVCRFQISVPTASCPNLVSLKGTHQAIHALLPGRNIMILHGMSILGCGRDYLLNYKVLSPEITRLRSLSMQNFFQFPDYTTLVEQYLQSLEFLELYELYQFVRLDLYSHGRALTFHLTQEDGMSLKLPPNIKVLVFSLRAPANTQSDYTSVEENIEIFFDRCRHLRQIDVVRPCGGESDHYRRWIRNAAGVVQEEPKHVSFEEVVRGRIDSIEWSEDSYTATRGE